MNNKKSTKQKSDINVPNKLSRIKIVLITLFIFTLMIALLGRVAYLQFVEGDFLQTSATSRQTLTETISAKRGNIYDATGNTVLAWSYETDKIYVYPKEIEDNNKELVAQGLAGILNLESAEILAKINDATSRVLIASNIEKEASDKLKDWKSKQDYITGVSIESSPSRSYPNDSLASTVIGFVGSDNQGSYGIESSWNSFLSGTAGKSVSLKDASQSEIANSQESYIAAENGYDLTLTIDANIQSIVENHLAQSVDKYECESGITVAMDPSTGKILAMADYPSFDCNNKDAPNSKLAEIWDTLTAEEKDTERFKMWNPKAITDTYEPGSVFKIITSAIAIEENLIEPNIAKSYNCSGSIIVPGEKKPIHCHKAGGHGYQSLQDALCNSCNPAFIQLGINISAPLSYKYYDAFGFFSKTGISLSGEPKSGIFYPIDTINDHELGTLSFGQGFTITPMQMITAASAIANDGVLLQPQIVQSITNTDTGEVTTFETKEVRQVISKETADTVASMMESVVTTGTGYRVKKDIEGMAQYSVGGKTGTSEPLNASSKGYIASFLAISPVENTKIVLLVILKYPQGELHNGGEIAAPTAGNMLKEILPYMGVKTGNEDDGNNSNLSENDLY